MLIFNDKSRYNDLKMEYVKLVNLAKIATETRKYIYSPTTDSKSLLFRFMNSPPGLDNILNPLLIALKTILF